MQMICLHSTVFGIVKFTTEFHVGKRGNLVTTDSSPIIGTIAGIRFANEV